MNICPKSICKSALLKLSPDNNIEFFEHFYECHTEKLNILLLFNAFWVGGVSKTDFLKTPIDVKSNIFCQPLPTNNFLPNSEIWDEATFTHCHCWKKISWEGVGFQKPYLIFRVGHGKCLRLLTRWVGGVKNGHKRQTCLRNIWMVP